MLLFKRVPHCYNANHDFKEKWKVRKMSCHIIVTILIESRCDVWSRSKGVQCVRYSSNAHDVFCTSFVACNFFFAQFMGKKEKLSSKACFKTSYLTCLWVPAVKFDLCQWTSSIVVIFFCNFKKGKYQQKSIVILALKLNVKLLDLLFASQIGRRWKMSILQKHKG